MLLSHVLTFNIASFCPSRGPMPMPACTSLQASTKSTTCESALLLAASCDDHRLIHSMAVQNLCATFKTDEDHVWRADWPAVSTCAGPQSGSLLSVVLLLLSTGIDHMPIWTG